MTAELGEPLHPLYTDLMALASSLIDVAFLPLYITYSTKEQPERLLFLQLPAAV